MVCFFLWSDICLDIHHAEILVLKQKMKRNILQFLAGYLALLSP